VWIRASFVAAVWNWMSAMPSVRRQAGPPATEVLEGCAVLVVRGVGSTDELVT